MFEINEGRCGLNLLKSFMSEMGDTINIIKDSLEKESNSHMFLNIKRTEN